MAQANTKNRDVGFCEDGLYHWHCIDASGCRIAGTVRQKYAIRFMRQNFFGRSGGG